MLVFFRIGIAARLFLIARPLSTLLYVILFLSLLLRLSLLLSLLPESDDFFIHRRAGSSWLRRSARNCTANDWLFARDGGLIRSKGRQGERDAGGKTEKQKERNRKKTKTQAA